MKITQLSTATGIIIALVIYILYLTQCKSAVKPCPESKTKPIVTTTTADTKPAPGTVYQPRDTIYVPKKVTIRGKDSLIFVPYEVVREVPQKIDTQSVIQAYYSKRIQQDSLIRDDVSVWTTDTVYQNQIIGRHWSVKTRSIKQESKRQFYFGGGMHTSVFMNKGLSTELISGGHVDFGYINRKGQHLKIDLERMNGRWHQGLSFYHTFGTNLFTKQQ